MFPSMEKTRRFRAVRLAMLAAACIAVSAGFGLHPEPGSSGAYRGSGFHGPAFSDGSPGAHDCLACRAHRPVVSAPAPAQVLGTRAWTVLAEAPRPPAIRVFPLLRLDGRSPPATS
jgi:hypothetical protein